MRADRSRVIEPDEQLLAEAADWLVCFQSGEASTEDRADFDCWRARSPLHAAAWQRAEQVLSTFEQVPDPLGRSTLQRLQAPDRRRALRALGMLLVAGPAAYTLVRQWPQWSADLRTATGEQQAVTLDDGTKLLLNTASAVNLRFSAAERRLQLLSGEILVTTGHEPAPQYRPFIVETPHGSVRALGTRFSVRRLDDATQVQVFEAAVEVRAGETPPRRLEAGEQLRFDSLALRAVEPVDVAAASWEHGMLLAQRMRLADLTAELSRYRGGFIRCHPQLAELRVSGAFPVRDTDESLRLLEKTLPLQISRNSRYWVTLEPR